MLDMYVLTSPKRPRLSFSYSSVTNEDINRYDMPHYLVMALLVNYSLLIYSKLTEWSHTYRHRHFWQCLVLPFVDLKKCNEKPQPLTFFPWERESRVSMATPTPIATQWGYAMYVIWPFGRLNTLCIVNTAKVGSPITRRQRRVSSRMAQHCQWNGFLPHETPLGERNSRRQNIRRDEDTLWTLNNKETWGEQLLCESP